MRAFITCAVLTVTVLTANVASAQGYTRESDVIDGWYHQYLGRHADRDGMHDHLRALRNGTPHYVVETAILASPEYYARNGNTPEGFVAALYRDVLGRRASGYEFNQEVRHVLREGRHAVALEFVTMRGAPVYTPTPIVVARPPVVITSPYVYTPPVVVPVYRPAPVYVAPRPAVSLRINVGR